MLPSAKKARLSAGVGQGKETHFLTIASEEDEASKVLLQQPVEIATASKDMNGNWTPGDKMLAWMKLEKLPYDLNHKYQEWQHVELGRAELTFEPILQQLTEQVANGTIKRPQAHVVSWRGNFSKIMCTPYNSGKDDWEIAVSRRNGVIYLDSRETEQCQFNKLNMNPTMRKFTYYGYKFENYCTGEGEKGVDTSVLGAGFHSIVAGKVGDIKYLIAAEVDCASGKPAVKNYMELKTSRLITEAHHRHTFEKHKMLKYWAQSITVGVPRVVVGFRNEEGQVMKLKRFFTAELPKYAGPNKERSEPLWTSKRCLSFLHRVLKWVDRMVQDDETWLLRLDIGDSELKLIRGVTKKPKHVFHPSLYNCISPARPDPWEEPQQSYLKKTLDAPRIRPVSPLAAPIS